MAHNVEQSPAELWLARHGETEWTLSRQHTGRTDIPLTERGERLARTELAPKLAGVAFDLVLASPLRRARDTAGLAGFEPDVDDRLREVDYGDYEGLTTAEIREQRPGWDLWTDGNPGGETVDDAGARMDALLAERIPATGRVLLFGHGHALRILAARRLGLPARDGRALLLPPAGVGVIASEHGRPAIARWGL
jgi:broad specificity phosphatase PhoE